MLEKIFNIKWIRNSALKNKKIYDVLYSRMRINWENEQKKDIERIEQDRKNLIERMNVSGFKELCDAWWECSDMKQQVNIGMATNNKPQETEELKLLKGKYSDSINSLENYYKEQIKKGEHGTVSNSTDTKTKN